MDRLKAALIGIMLGIGVLAALWYIANAVFG